MKKYIILALLFVPMVAFGASSVRVLGNKATTPAVKGTTATKAIPAKTAAVATTGDSSVSRVGAVRAKTKTGTTTASATSNSRFPVITPAHSYSSVASPKPSGG